MSEKGLLWSATFMLKKDDFVMWLILKLNHFGHNLLTKLHFKLEMFN